ncbi:HWE histidine kinase domain-containing protein [Sphingomonas sp. 3-13AW]|uniref:HWE histidine kinase domain-containing protein n=1 Tax=Sphingomonas sp. 3-13AW TaxID=3050450 RepID=UPI003BB7DCA4
MSAKAEETASATERLRKVEVELAEATTQLRHMSGLLEEAERRAMLSSQRAVLMEGELHHRVRNMLAVVRLIFSRTTETRTSMVELADHFLGRLDAIGRYHVGSPGMRERRLNVEDAVRDELLLVGVGDDDRVSIKGPELLLQGREAESFGLALHELMTNSVKFGLLSPGATTGTLSIEWEDSAGILVFRWQERGMPIIGPAPLRHGFGREFIEEFLPYQHDARTSFELSAGRLTCIIEMRMGNSDEQMDVPLWADGLKRGRP